MATLTIPKVTGPSFLAWLERDTRLKKAAATRGGEYAGACPFCGGRDRFRAWPEQGRYWCRQCGARGDAIDYLRRRDGLGFREAVRTLGGDVPSPSAGRLVAPVKSRTEPAKGCEKPAIPPWIAAGQKLAGECHEALLKDAEALAWLHGRGLSDRTIAEFGLGFNAGTGYRYGVYLPAGWVIPMQGVDGGFYGLQTRRLDGAEPKYQLAKGAHHPLLGRLTGKPALLVCEGALDMMLAWQIAGDLVDVATLGSASADPRPWALHLLSYQRILLCYDLDDAGEQGRAKWAGIGGVVQVRLPLSGGKDVTDFVKAGGDLRGWGGFSVAAGAGYSRR
jgi:DNA primase